MPVEFYDLVAHNLPPERPVAPQGGRPRICHRAVVRVIGFVLVSGTRWEDVPPELGCSGRTAHRRLRSWEEAGIWDRLHADLLRLLRHEGKLDTDLVVIDSVFVRAFGGGELAGPSPVDRRKPGTKHTLKVSRLGCRWPSSRRGPTPATTPRSSPSSSTSRGWGKPGRPKELPDVLYAYRGYDSDATR
ncbi:MAG: transposase [Gemmataceae bacterium]